MISRFVEETKYMPHKRWQTNNNYRPVSLLPVCVEVFERMIFNSLFECLEKYELLSAHQSGFWANDTCVDQFLSIVHNIYTAFDKVWHEWLILKLRSMGIYDALLDLRSFVEKRFQRVVLNCQASEWLPVEAGVPQGSFLGPRSFLIYINDLSIDIISTVKLFADDASLFSIIHEVKTTAYEIKFCRK